jgi:SPX domain protein involved in polyphosphate accumulation
MPRIEYKYLIPDNKVELFRQHIKPYVRLDKYSAQKPDQHYTVRSIYYDTARLKFYHEKISGIKKRQKIRIRGYDSLADNSIAFLEVKQKNGPAIKKYRAPLLYKNLDNIISSGDIEKYIFPNNGAQDAYQNARNFFYYIHRLNLRPNIKIIYEREAYYFKFHRGLRVTIDKNLRSSLSVSFDTFFEEQNLVFSLAKQSIIEVKVFGGLHVWLRDILAQLGLRLQALSIRGLAQFNGF